MSLIRRETRSGHVVLTLDKARGNAMNPALIEELLGAAREAAEDDSVRILTLTVHQRLILFHHCGRVFFLVILLSGCWCQIDVVEMRQDMSHGTATTRGAATLEHDTRWAGEIVQRSLSKHLPWGSAWYRVRGIDEWTVAGVADFAKLERRPRITHGWFVDLPQPKTDSASPAL